ncbi:MAG TPA: hypothetical protein VD764_13665 [Nocardioides sp.]|jgi:hypothetical protein|nr:hypothetical protein [Nocardioides sp.]
MENYTMTMTAWTPSFGMSTLGRPCAHTRALGAGVVAVQGDAAASVRIKGDFPGSPAWSPSS